MGHLIRIVLIRDLLEIRASVPEPYLPKLFEGFQGLAHLTRAAEGIGHSLHFQKLFDRQSGAGRTSGGCMHRGGSPLDGLARLFVFNAGHQSFFHRDAPGLQSVDDLLRSGLGIHIQVVTNRLAAGTALVSCHGIASYVWIDIDNGWPTANQSTVALIGEQVASHRVKLQFGIYAIVRQAFLPDTCAGPPMEVYRSSVSYFVVGRKGEKAKRRRGGGVYGLASATPNWVRFAGIYTRVSQERLTYLRRHCGRQNR